MIPGKNVHKRQFFRQDNSERKGRLILMKKDSYKTIDRSSEGIFKDRGSKFLAFAFPVIREEEVKKEVQKIKKKYYDARHHCYAYKIGVGEGSSFRVNDDGEPSGTAGKPIYGQILSNDLSDILIIVVRYFGGILLGTSGLINAYRNAAADCIANSGIIERVIKERLRVRFGYDLMSAIMRIVKDEDLDVLEQDFKEDCLLTLNIRLSEYERIEKRIKNVYGLYIENTTDT